MIPAMIISFFAGAIIASFAAALYHYERIKLMKADVVAALREQATDSYRKGYMHGYAALQTRKEAKITARNVYQSVNV